MQFDLSKTINGNFIEAIEQVTASLKTEGFGVITETDLKDKFKEKLDIDFRNYKILGACNPRLAYEAIQVEDKLGVMLPCNILVQEHTDGRIEVSAINPLASIGALENEKIKMLAQEVSEKLKRVIDNLK